MAKGLTDAQLDAMDEMEARQNLYGTAAKVLESPAAVPMTDAQMDQRATSDSLMQTTPFGQKTMPQSAPQPPQADFREPPKPLTDAELNAQEDNLYYDPSYEMPFEEFAPVHARRQQEKNTVGSFVDGAVAAGQGLVSLTAEMGQELKDNATSNFYRPDRFATQNFVTLKEAGRKAGLEFAKLVDWIGNTARDHATDVRRQEQVRSVIAQKLQAEGKLSGDLRGDTEIINRKFAAAKERGETAPTPLEENADVKQAFEDYRRGKNFDREIAGVGNFNIGQAPVTQESSEARATNPITGEVMEPQRALATGGSMALAPDNLLPVGAGALSKVRILRRLSSITGVPLKITEQAANVGADALQRSTMRITDRVRDFTGMNAAQQTAAATVLTGGVGYLSAQGQGTPAALGGVATGVLSILPIMKFGGAVLRRTGSAAGGGYAIVREMGAGGAGVAGAEAADAMAKSGAFPQRYARHMQPGGASVDSTLRRVSQNPENPQMLRRLSRTANNLGATQAFRLADDAVSSAVVSGLTAAPFALVAPDAEQGGQIVGGAVMLGAPAGMATRAFGRRPTEVDADIARMLVDVTKSNGDAASLMSLSHDSLSQLAAMQGVLRNKVKFIPLRGQDYRANTDLRAEGGETAAGLYIEKDANGSARIFVNMGHTAPMDGKVSVRPDADKGGNVIDITAADGTVDSTHVPQGIRLLVKTGDAVSANQRLAQDLSPTRIVPHEIGHAILTSDILGGQPRNDLRNLVNQQYATDGVAARGREYATRLVDKDILVGAIEDAPVNLTDAQINDISSGKTTLADVLKGQPVSEQARQRLIDQRVEELSQRSIEKGQDPLDWARDEIIAETFASEAPAIDFRAIRRDALFPRLAESMLSAGGRVLEVMGARLDPGTGKLMDNPSVLFRDNPLFQDRIMQKRVREYVRSYDQYLAGLEEAGAKELRGVELARSSKPEDLARSTHVKLRDEGNGVLENDFMVQRPDGTYTMKAQKTVNLTENARSAQIKTLYDARKFVPVNSQEFGKRKVNGREVVGGPVLPKQFDFFTNFPKYLRPDPTTGDIGLVRKIEASREDGGSWDIDVNVIGTGSSGRYRVINLGNTRAVQRETVPYGWIISKANHLLAASLDLNAFRASAMKAINKGDLGLFNNDMRQVEADLKTYLANHRNGMPGEMTIGQQKRDMLNGLIGTGTAVQRTANPLYSDLNPRGSIRTWRVDRLNDAKPTGRTGYFFDYDKINNNRMPSALPQAGMAMPDTPANLSTDQILRELEENQGYLGLSTLGMREGRPVKGGAQQTRELLKRNTALNEELKRRGGPQEESDVERVLRQRGQAMPDVDVQWETYAENLRDDVESWSPARDTGKIDYEMQDVVDSFVDFARTNPQLAGGELTAAFYRAEKPTASQRKKLNAAIANVGEPPRVATGGTRGQAMPDGSQPVRGQAMADVGSAADETPRRLIDMPQSALKVLHANSAELPKPAKKLTNATVALTLADVAEKHNNGIITSSNITPEQKSDLMILGADEAEAALKASGKNAGNWYSVAIEAALGIAGVIYRELSDAVAARSHAVLAKETDPVKAGQFALRLPLAITSQNMTVKLNTRASNEQFNIFLKTGKFDPSIAYGEKAKSISGNLDLANTMIDELGSVLALEDFVSRQFTVRELEIEASKIAGRSIKIAGRKDDIVNGAAIFGPKIGQGFLQNLMGKFDPVTIDLWMRRTWGRWTGDVVGDGVTAQRLARLVDQSRKSGRKLPDSIKRLRTTMRSMGETKTGKAKKPELTMSEDVEARLEAEAPFRKEVEAFAKEVNAEFQGLYKLMSDVMSPALSKKVQDAIERAERLPDQADAILSDVYNAVVREQSRVKQQLDKKWSGLSLDEKREMAARRLPGWADVKPQDRAKFIKKSKLILKGDWLEMQHQAEGRTAKLGNPQKNLIKPAWANAAKSIVSELNPIDIPSDMDRRVITEVVNGIREELERRGHTVTNADVQAILWYPEKDLWAKLRGEEESILKQSYDDEFINIAEGLGLGLEARKVAKQIRGY
jgi:hypothetical protein